MIFGKTHMWVLNLMFMGSLFSPGLALGVDRAYVIQTQGHQGEAIGGVPNQNSTVTIVVTDSLDGSPVTGLVQGDFSFDLIQGPSSFGCDLQIQSFTDFSVAGVYLLDVGTTGVTSCSDFTFHQGEYLYYVSVSSTNGADTFQGVGLGVIGVEGFGIFIP